MVLNFKSQETKQVIQDLKDTLKACQEGLGLAAPQIGTNLRIFVLESEEKIAVFINPKITRFSRKTTLHNEGCLSVPGRTDEIARASKVILKYYDEDGKKHKIKAAGLLAEAFQHEIDHLDGILYIDKIKNPLPTGRQEK